MSCREKEGLLVHVTFSMQVQPQSVSTLTTQGATDNIGANVTEFSLDRPQRSWPMQLEGLGFRFSGYIGISDNWQPSERWLASENRTLEEYRILLAKCSFHHSIHETIEFPS